MRSASITVLARPAMPFPTRALFRLFIATAFAAVCSGCATPPAPAPADPVKPAQILWLGQSAFRIVTPGGKTIVIDPYLSAGPRAPAPYKTDLSALGKVDLLLVTHAHQDHLGDAPKIARLNNTPIYGPADMIGSMITLGIIPAELGYRFNKSGTVEPLPGIKVTPVHAEHSSLLVWKNPATGKNEAHPGGEPVGYIIELENGLKIWDMGDTGLFSDMAWIAAYYKPDLVMMPIGGNFTMGPVDAAWAAINWVKAPRVMPIHYGSNPMAKGTLKEFQDAMAGSGITIVAPSEGQPVTLP
jgi:L-ascorbate metabolism protein UlaG (beta-lactamase superfamily)